VNENLKKESLKLEDSNTLLESKILKLKDDLKDSSSVHTNGTDSHVSNASGVNAKIIICL